MKYLKKVDGQFIWLIVFMLSLWFLTYYIISLYFTIDEDLKILISAIVSGFVSPWLLFLYNKQKTEKKLQLIDNIFREWKYVDALIEYSKSNYKFNRRLFWYNSWLCLEHLKCYEEAIMYYDDVISTNPSYIDAYFRKSVCFDFLEKNKESLEQIDKCIALDDKNHIYYYQKWRILNKWDKKQESIDAFEQWINLDTENNDITFNVFVILFGLYIDIKNEDDALLLCDKWISKFSNKYDFYLSKWSLLSNDMSDLNKIQSAYDTLFSAIKYVWYNKEIYSMLVLFISLLLQQDKNIWDLQEYDNIYCTYIENSWTFSDNFLYSVWWNILFNLKLYDDALEKYNLVEREKVDESIYIENLVNISKCCVMLWKYDMMLKKCDEWLKIYEGHNELLIWKAIALNALWKYDEALILSDLIDFSNNKQYLYVKFDCLYRLERYQEVIDNIDIFNEQDIYLLNMKWLAYKHLKQYDESLKIFDFILQKNEKSFMTYINKWSLLFEQKKYQKSLVELNYVISNIDSSEKNYWYLLGMTYLSYASIYLVWYNDVDKVLTNLEKAIKYDDSVKQKIIDDKDFDSVRDDERYKKLMQISN